MKRLVGTGASSGLCIGTARIVPRRAPLLMRPVEAPPQEQALFEAARILAKDELVQVMAAAPEAQRDIFLFQQSILDDIGLNEAITAHIGKGLTAPAAVEAAGEEFAARLQKVEDEYISQRAADITDVCNRVVDILDARERTRFSLKAPAVLVAHDILPSDLMAVNRELILGFVTSGGSLTGHAAILAKSMGIPAVVAAGDMLAVQDGELCALDGDAGEVFFSPDEGTKARFSHMINLARRRSISRERLQEMPCVTKSGVEVTLLANCSTAQEVAAAMASGAQGVGLLRSEFLYMRAGVPSEEEQYLFYKECLCAAAGKPVTVRTFDIGADKLVTGISPTGEENPAMGLRGLRLALAREDLFLPHLRALLRAGLHGPLKVMFPMVCNAREFEGAMAMVARARESLQKDGLAFAQDIPFGSMIETPAAAILAGQLAAHAAFFSIGTNDLTQYTLAADRVNPAVASYYTPASPAVMALVNMAVAAANQHGRGLSICGEAAGEPALAVAYVGAGVTTLSMAAPALLQVKEALIEAPSL
ncbi:phosphoenolpyruvate--protein phosphotransferase [Ruminococcaceae bacterium OttesenSCG-928-N02]|nr:phosphoenolpyruvate--protein phosphotransferase [Ruminococcaceae bacterium OttesenSCG-928-N02]